MLLSGGSTVAGRVGSGRWGFSRSAGKVKSRLAERFQALANGGESGKNETLRSQNVLALRQHEGTKLLN